VTAFPVEAVPLMPPAARIGSKMAWMSWSWSTSMIATAA
jgi:hypothetical protein